jgi:3-methyladenine DNA glycosylase Tag
MRPPEQIEDASPADILESITKAVFQAGISWRVVEAKWPGFREAFHGFDPERVAAMTPDDVARLREDTRIIRNRRKIEATVHNAEAVLASTRTHRAGSARGSDRGAASRRPSTRCAASSSSWVTSARTTCST